MSRSLSGHIPIHRSSWMVSLRTHRCMSQFHRASLSCFVKLFLTCYHYDGRPRSKFCVAVSGFKVPGPLSAAVFSDGYATPTLHVLGRNDILVVEERSRTLINVSIGKRVEEHDGGTRHYHHLPALGLLIHWGISVLSKATSCHPGPAGGHFSKHTCSIPQVMCLALAHPQCRSQGQVRSHRCRTDVLGESRHLALVERWRCASVLRYGYDRARIHGFATVCDCDWGLMTSRPCENG